MEEEQAIPAAPDAGSPIGGNSGGSWIVAGLGAFGLVVGVVTGLSVQQGISATLLTSLFTFAGGAVLTYAGFSRRTRAAGGVEIDLRRTGASLLVLSLAVLVGVSAGIFAREIGTRYLTAKTLRWWPELNPPAQVVPQPKSAAGPQPAGPVVHVTLQGDTVELCNEIGARINSKEYGGDSSALRDLSNLHQATCLAAHP